MQMAKLGVALVKGRTGHSAAVPMETEGSAAPAPAHAADDNHVAPQQLKSLVGKNHPEFGSSRQQVIQPICCPIQSFALKVVVWCSIRKYMPGAGCCMWDQKDGSTALQDAVEYFQYFLDILNRAEHGAAERLGGTSSPPTAAAFTYLVRMLSWLSHRSLITLLTCHRCDAF